MFTSGLGEDIMDAIMEVSTTTFILLLKFRGINRRYLGKVEGFLPGHLLQREDSFPPSIGEHLLYKVFTFSETVISPHLLRDIFIFCEGREISWGTTRLSKCCKQHHSFIIPLRILVLGEAINCSKKKTRYRLMCEAEHTLYNLMSPYERKIFYTFCFRGSKIIPSYLSEGDKNDRFLLSCECDVERENTGGCKRCGFQPHDIFSMVYEVIHVGSYRVSPHSMVTFLDERDEFNDIYHLDLGEEVMIICNCRGNFTLKGLVEKAKYSVLYASGRVK